MRGLTGADQARRSNLLAAGRGCLTLPLAPNPSPAPALLSNEKGPYGVHTRTTVAPSTAYPRQRALYAGQLGG